MFKVSAKRCNECLFSNNKIVNDQRKQQILDDCNRQAAESYFICHQFNGQDVCCRGFWDAYPSQPGIMQIAKRLQLFEFVPLPNKESSDES